VFGIGSTNWLSSRTQRNISWLVDEFKSVIDQYCIGWIPYVGNVDRESGIWLPAGDYRVGR
jgi:hypothetical protein